MSLIFDCICGDTFHEADYPSFAAYRQTTDAHRERCDNSPRAIDRLVVDAVAPDADPDSVSRSPVRQAADEVERAPSPAAPSSAATHRRGFLSGVPGFVARRWAVGR